MRRRVLSVSILLLIFVVANTGLWKISWGEDAHPPNKVLYHERLEALPQETSKLGVWLSRWKPGEVTPLHFHHGPGILCVLEGELMIRIPSQKDLRLKAESCWQEIPRLIHSPSNPGRTDAVAIFVLIHPTDKPVREDVK
jgi:quercetin dioxygenase-like cupin family protein